jgi:ABC-type transporter Mla subunit MlaD
LPSQKQLKWSELRVGITVIVASVTLAVLVFLISGTSGFLTKKITLITYFDNAEGLRDGQPVDLQGVAIGNVRSVRVVPGRPLDSVQVVMRINSKYLPFIREDSKVSIMTAGVLGESFVDIDSKTARGPIAKDGSGGSPEWEGNIGPGYQRSHHDQQSQYSLEPDPGIIERREQRQGNNRSALYGQNAHYQGE